jgi:lysophospholipase L1-like esterase
MNTLTRAGAVRRMAFSLMMAGALLAGCAAPAGYVSTPDTPVPVYDATGAPTYTTYITSPTLPTLPGLILSEPTLPENTEAMQASPTPWIVSPTPIPSSTPTSTLDILVTPTAEIPQHPPNAANLAGKIIVIYGDSITMWGSPRPNGNGYGYSYAMYLQDYLEGIAEVKILGIGGKATPYGLEHIDEVISEEPDIVVLAWGTNDPDGCQPQGILNYHYQRFRENTDAMIERLIAYKSDIDIIIPTVIPMLGWFPVDLSDPSGKRCDYNSYLENIVDIQREIVAEQQQLGRNVWLVETRRDYKLEMDVTTNLYTDIIHPNRNGHWVMARTYLEFFGFEPPTENPYK